MKINRQTSGRLVRIGCAALALALSIGTVPFLRGLAAEKDAAPAEATVSPADLSVVSSIDLPDASSLDEYSVTSASVAPSVRLNSGITSTFEDGVLTFTGSGTLTETDVGRAIEGVDQKTIGTINIEGDISVIGEGAFDRIKGTSDGNTTLNIGNSVQTIEPYAFNLNYDLDHLNIGSGVTNIGYRAFYECSAIKSITIPDSVTTIGDFAFFYCISSASVTIGNHVTSIGEHAFSYSSATSYTIPASVRNIGANAFSDGGKLTDIVFEGTSLDQCGEKVCKKDSITVHLPCEHFNVNGTVINASNKEFYFSESVLDIPETRTETTGAHEPTCTEDGYTGDLICSVCGFVVKGGEATDATGHDWNEWKVTAPPTDAEAGQETRVCRNDPTHKEARGLQYAFTSDKYQWAKGSKNGMTVAVKNVAEDGDDSTTYGRFHAVYVDGEECADFSKKPGSVIITLSPAFLKALSVGEHTVKVEFKVGDTVIPAGHSFTVVEPASVPSPGTGEGGTAGVVCVALMLLAAYGAVYALLSRKPLCSDVAEEA